MVIVSLGVFTFPLYQLTNNIIFLFANDDNYSLAHTHIDL